MTDERMSGRSLQVPAAAPPMGSRATRLVHTYAGTRTPASPARVHPALAMLPMGRAREGRRADGQTSRLRAEGSARDKPRAPGG